MPVRETVQVGNEVIHAKAAKVSDVSSIEVKDIVTDLVDTMRDAGLVGLAAPQLGHGVRIFVTEIRETETRKLEFDELKVFINPEIIEVSDNVVEDYEGCGSIANGHLFALVPRADAVTVRAFNLAGEEITVEATGLLARIILHEYDHLEGVTFLERVTNMRSIMGRAEYIAMRKEQAK